MSYNSKYTGQEVEELLDQVKNSGTGGGGITSESDPIYSASPAAKITDENISSWNDKVDKVDGKQLSTEDFTTLLKQKLEGLSNYDDTAIQESVSKLRTDLDTLVSGDTTTAIKTFNEIIAFLDGIEDSQSLDSIIASIEQQIASKQDAITDLATIREGASKGATALQEVPNGYAKTEDIPTKVSELENDKEYYTPIYDQNKTFVIDIPQEKWIHVNSDLALNEELIENLNIQYKNNIVTNKYGGITALGGTAKSYRKQKINGATTEKAGFMSAADKTKLDGIDMTKKQDTLVSGTNIKTINGESILGEGNIVIEGGSSSGGTSSGGSGAYAEVNHGTSDTTFTLTPNTFHVWDEVASLDLSFGAETSGVANEYLFQFTSGATATTLTLPDDIKWANDSAPTIAENMIYQISVLKGLASVLEFGNKPNVDTISFKVRTYECVAEEGMTWEQWVSSEYNTINCSLIGNNVQRYGEVVGTSYTIYVTKTDIIISDFEYVLIPMT